MSKKTFLISASGLKNIVLASKSFSIFESTNNIEIKEDEFLFIFGERGIKMNRIFAEFISPRVSSLHKTDQTINTIHINFSENDKKIIFDHEILEKFLLISIGEAVEIDSNDAIQLRLLSQYLENEEIFIKMNELFPIKSAEKNIDKCIQYLKYYESLKTSFPINNDQIIKTISSQFNSIDTKKLIKLPLPVLYSILSNDELKLNDEDSLFDFVQILFSHKENQKNEIDKLAFYELIDISALSYDKFIEFINEINYGEITGEIWSRIKNYFIMNKNRKTIINNKRYAKTKYKLVSFDKNESNRFKGIIYTLGDGNPRKVLTDKIINIHSSSPYNNSESSQNKNVVNFDDYSGAFQSVDDENAWLAYDFKNRKVCPSCYSIRSTNWGGTGHSHLQSWIIEGSNDFQNWKMLDLRKNDRSLDGNSFSNTFSIEKRNGDEYFQYLRIMLNGRNTSGGIRLDISALEFFGIIQDL